MKFISVDFEILIYDGKIEGLEITNQPRIEETRYKVIILLISKRITKIILQDHKSIEPRLMAYIDVTIFIQWTEQSCMRIL